MEFEELSVKDVVLITPRVFGDQRGYFMETWNERDFRQGGIEAAFVQDNQSRSGRGTLRGLHYQIRQPQGKLLRVVAGEVYDVAVDLRRSSPTFGKWVGVRLSAENKKMLWVPTGFAHGFYVMSDFAEFVYKCTDFYAPEHERSLRWDDPEVGIDWPLVKGEPPLLSAKDQAGKSLKDLELFP